MSTRRVWHEETDLSDFDAIVLPGGFSYGDYLRCGAIARFAPALQSLIDFAAKGGRVLGISADFRCSNWASPWCTDPQPGSALHL